MHKLKDGLCLQSICVYTYVVFTLRVLTFICVLFHRLCHALMILISPLDLYHVKFSSYYSPGDTCGVMVCVFT